MRKYLFNANQVETSVIIIPINTIEINSINSVCRLNAISTESIKLLIV